MMGHYLCISHVLPIDFYELPIDLPIKFYHIN